MYRCPHNIYYVHSEYKISDINHQPIQKNFGVLRTVTEELLKNQRHYLIILTFQLF